MRINHQLLFVLAAVALALPADAAEPPAWRVTYLANEGVLLEASGKKVLVDALFGDGIKGYPVVPDNLRSNLELAKDEFSSIDLVLATHEHDDHFSAIAVTKHLEANPSALFLSTPDAIGKMNKKLSARSILPTEGDEQTIQHRGITVHVLRMHHGRTRAGIQNLGFLIEIGDVRFLHVGDTELSATEWQAFHLASRGITVALLPSWQAKKSTLRHIRAQYVAAFHLAEANAPRSWFGPYSSRDERVQALQRVPGVTVLTHPGQELSPAN